MEQKRLILQAVSGDEAAFCALYAQYKDKLYRFALYRLGNTFDAEDAVSDCVLSAYRQIASLKAPEAFAAWLFKILHACCNRIIAQQIKLSNATDIDTVTTVSANDMDTAIQRTELWQALETLSEEERQIVLLSVISGLNSREIARLTDYTPGAVRSKLSRSLAKMRTFLETE